LKWLDNEDFGMTRSPTAETAEQASTQPACMILAKMAARLGSASACRIASGRTSSIAG
jgi:hypothetical protein